MRIRFIYILLLQSLIISSCGQGDKKEKAGQYYDTFLEAIRPYKSGTENILKETKGIIEQRIKSTGDIKLSTQDSLRVAGLFNDFQLLTEKTKLKINELKTFDGLDLKISALEYIDKSSNAISGSYKEIVFPFQDGQAKMSQEKLESLINKFSAEFKEANKNFSDTQRAFLDKFGIPAN